jgi:hypothetical protein
MHYEPLIAIGVLTLMYIKELALIDDGWRYYDPLFSTILDRRSNYFCRVGKTTYYRGKDYAKPNM